MSQIELSKIKGALQTFLKSPTSGASYEELSKTVNIQQLILILNSQDITPTIYQQIIKSIEKCFSLYQLRYDILNNPEMQELLLKATELPSNDIHILISKALELTSRETIGQEILQNENTIHMLINLLPSEHLEVYQAVENTLLKIIKQTNSVFTQFFDHPKTQKMIQSLDSSDEITTIRLLTLFISMGKISPEIFDLIEDKQIYQKVIQLFLHKDVIIQMNSVEMVNQMISYAKGFEFLCQDNFPNLYLRELKFNDFEPIVAFLMKFLSECVERYPDLTAKIFQDASEIFTYRLKEHFNLGIPSKDGSKLTCFVVCWAHINTHPLGYHYLKDILPNANETIADFVSGEKGRDLTLHALSAWLKVLQSKSEMIDLLKPIVENELIEKVMKLLIMDPFKEMRAMAYHLVQLLINNYPIFVEIFFNSKEHRNLLIRNSTDTDSQVKYAKYDFVKACTVQYHTIIAEIAGQDYIQLLHEYIKSGPFHQFKGLKTSISDTPL